VRILTDDAHTKARIREIDDRRLHADLEAGNVVVVAGFQGIDEHGNITTLGRGGSDTSAVAHGRGAVGRRVPDLHRRGRCLHHRPAHRAEGARLLDRITFEEMLEMASLGLEGPADPGRRVRGKIPTSPCVCCHSFQDGEGTLITFEEDDEHGRPPRSPESPSTKRRGQADRARCTGSCPASRTSILGPISDANIEVDVIVQNVAEDNSTDFTFTVGRGDLARAGAVLERTAEELGAREVRSDSRIAKVSVVGVGMRSHAGVASRMFAALADVGINIQMITTSEIKISVIIEEKFLELAVRALHSAFELDAEPMEESAA
jgi:aspartate kinase